MLYLKQLLTASILLVGFLFTTQSSDAEGLYGKDMVTSDKFNFNIPKLKTHQNQIDTLCSYAYALKELRAKKDQEKIDDVYRNAHATIRFIESQQEEFCSFKTSCILEEALIVMQQLILCDQANESTCETALNLVQKYNKTQNNSVKKEILVVLQNLVHRQNSKIINDLAKKVAQNYLSSNENSTVRKEANKLLEQIRN